MAVRKLDAAVLAGVTAHLRDLNRPAGFVGKNPPPGTWVYLAENLKFPGKGDEAYWAHASFARLVNRLPDATSTTGWQDGFLWSIYEAVLGARLANNTLDKEEQQRYDDAHTLLYVDSDGDDPPEHTKVWKTYQTLKARYETADLAYRRGEEKAKASGDEEVWRRWVEKDGPALDRVRQEAMADWLNQGRKLDVERAIRTINELSKKSPVLAWDRFRRIFNPDNLRHWLTDPGGGKYAESHFSPHNLVDHDWPRVRLSRADLDRLVGGSVPVDDRITGCAFDYGPAEIVRPWFSHGRTMFTARAWRFTDSNARPLSDGGDPPTGRCPAVAETIQFARNITVFRRPAKPGETPSSVPLTDLDLVADTAVSADETYDIVFTKSEFWWDRDVALSFEDGSTAEWHQGEDSSDKDYGRYWTGTGGDLKYICHCAPLAPNVSYYRFPANTDFGSVTGARLRKVPYQTKDRTIDLNDQAGTMPVGTVLAIRTRNNKYAKVIVLEYPMDGGVSSLVKIGWALFGEVSAESTPPESVYAAALHCRLLPRSPDPDPRYDWG